MDEKNHCVWCQIALTGKKYKWCGPECMESAFAWANPQKEQGLQVLLARQSWKCNLCQYDYAPHVEETRKKMSWYYPEMRTLDVSAKFHWVFVKRLKRLVPKNRRPEVDHIVPIYKGGQSLGLDNHQAICYLCHKAKTKKDLSGKRSKDGTTS